MFGGPSCAHVTFERRAHDLVTRSALESISLSNHTLTTNHTLPTDQLVSGRQLSSMLAHVLRQIVLA